ncbi:MAG: hypothetical protein WDN75_21190 [Bacteroidota bacterium]
MDEVRSLALLYAFSFRLSSFVFNLSASIFRLSSLYSLPKPKAQSLIACFTLSALSFNLSSFIFRLYLFTLMFVRPHYNSLANDRGAINVDRGFSKSIDIDFIRCGD